MRGLTADSVRRTLRTALAVTVAVAAAIPVLVEVGAIDPSSAPWLATIVALATAVTRFMASDRADAILGSVLGEPFTRGAVEVGEVEDGHDEQAPPFDEAPAEHDPAI